MSTTERKPTQEAARTWVLISIREFIEEWDRFHSILTELNLRLSDDICEAEGKGKEQIEAFIPKVFSMNLTWLLEQFEPKVEKLAFDLKAAGVQMPLRI